jgi:putative membrane protein
VNEPPDARSYLAAERTFLAWLRTGIALMGFGFVIARFGLFLRELAALGTLRPGEPPGASIVLGLVMILAGVAVNLCAAWRHRAFVRALDENRFRSAYAARLPMVIAVGLALVGVALAAYLLGV